MIGAFLSEKQHLGDLNTKKRGYLQTTGHFDIGH